MNLGKSGLGGIFDTFWYGKENVEESGPEMEISGRDLDFGGDGTGRKNTQMIQKMPGRLKTDFCNGWTSFGTNFKVFVGK